MATGTARRFQIGKFADVDPIISQLQADVRQLQQDGAEMRAVLAALQAPRAPIVRRGDHALLEALLQRVGPRVAFNASELVAHSGEDSALAAALAEAGVSTAQRLGRRLRRLAKAGLVQRLERDGAGCVWVLPGDDDVE